MNPPAPRRPRQSVLIVDGSEDSREVLRTALTRRGVDAFAARAAEEGLRLARSRRPNVIVLDAEELSCDDTSYGEDDIWEVFDAESRRQNATLVVLGGLQRSAIGADRPRHVSKPYHYGPLVRKIETLLQQASAADGSS